MQAYRIETTVVQDGELLLHELPLKAGEVVEVIILSGESANDKPANGKPSNENGITDEAKVRQTPLTDAERKRRAEALASISSGKYAHKTESGLLASEEFSLHKAEEKALEERRWK